MITVRTHTAVNPHTAVNLGCVFASMRQSAFLIAPVLCAFIFIVMLFGAIAKGIETRDFFIFGEKGMIFCVSGQDETNPPADHFPNTHHPLDCCLLHVPDHSIRVIAIDFLPFAVAYNVDACSYDLKVQFYDAPPIARTDGVFPHDIPVRAPPASFV